MSEHQHGHGNSKGCLQCLLVAVGVEVGFARRVHEKYASAQAMVKDRLDQLNGYTGVLPEVTQDGIEGALHTVNLNIYDVMRSLAMLGEVVDNAVMAISAAERDKPKTSPRGN